MSEQDQAASIGRLILECKTSNEKLVAIEAEFLRHSETLKSLSSLLARSRRANGDRNMVGSADLDADLSKMPDTDRLRSLVSDAREELSRFNDLSAQRRQLGL